MSFHPSHFLIPACIVASGALVSFIPKWGIPAMLIMCGIALAATTYIVIAGLWEAKADYWRGLAQLAKTLPNLTPAEKEALRIAAPEIGFVLQAGNPVLVLAGSSICPADFFIEFLDNGNPQTTWAKREINNTEKDSREVRRRQWDDLCHYLAQHDYLTHKPMGADSWMWRPGAWRELYSKYVGSIPNLDNAPDGWSNKP